MFNLKPCILMKQYVKLHKIVVILTVTKSQVMATYLEKSEQLCDFVLLYFSIYINRLFVECFVSSYYGAFWYHH